MTTIVYDGCDIAVDRCATAAGLKQPVDKWCGLPDGRLALYSGDLTMGALIVLRLVEGTLFKNWPKQQEEGEDGSCVFLLVDTSAGTILELGQFPVWMPIVEPSCWGSGAAVARGALEAGANAKRCVEIASKFDPYTGFGVDVFRVR